MLIAAYLEEFGLTYDMASERRRGARLLQAAPYDLVLMDIVMPELDGVETTKRIRKMPRPGRESRSSRSPRTP